MSGKDKYYWSQLRTALTAGQWAAPFPAKTPNGTALSWSELFRKFNKHCTGYKDVAEVASQTHALALLLAANSNKDKDIDVPPKTGEFALELGSECTLPEERVAEATECYDALKKLESSNFDTLNFALAYYAYALGNPSECLSHLKKVPDVSRVNEHIPMQATTRTTTLSLQIPGAASAEPSISSVGGSHISGLATDSADANDGRAWAMTESLRSICLQGMSYEKLFPSEPDQALEVYSVALPLLAMSQLELVSPASPIGASGKLSFTSFTRFRELWRWVEYIIWRAVTISARICDVHREDLRNVLWTWLTHYSTCSAFWPSNFRTAHRSTISVLYIRALVLRNASPLPPADVGKPPPWLHTARSIIQEYRAILSVSTSFPHAGQHNVKVEEFVDLCVAVWEASGSVGDYAGWVIDVLWWATRMTFNSFRILRHMTRLLHVSGDTPLAKRTLKLYVQIVGKAWQASGAAISEDTDTNRDWVETLVVGSRMLCKFASLTDEGIEDIREAGRLLDLARTRLDLNNSALGATIDLAEGVWNSAMALKERDPHSRPKRLAKAHSLFLKAVEAHPTPSGYYHLALSFARPGSTHDLEQATVYAGLAVEGDPKEIRYWHLIGLLLAASEQWKAAEEILAQGAEIGETLQEDELTIGSVNPEMLGANGHGVNGRAIDGLPAADAAHPGMKRASIPPTSPAPTYLLDKPDIMPPAAGLLLPVADHAAPSRQEMFEYSLQLRMTQVALTEHVEGAEGAAEKWLEVFQWIAERRGITPTPSESGRNHAGMANLKSPSELVLSMSRSSHDKGSNDTSHQQPPPLAPPQNAEALVPPSPIPITISPATPEEAPRNFSADYKAVTENISEEPANGAIHDSIKRSFSIDRDTSKSKKMQQMLKNRVNKGQARISTISKKIGSGVVRNGTLRRSSSTPDFHAVLRQTSYQASSIHSRRHLGGSLVRRNSITPSESPPPPPTVPPAQSKWSHRTARETRLESDLWLMSAATFRRLGKIEQAKGAIQEAEVKDEGNPAVWVQLGLYYVALGHTQYAIDAFQKALFINPDDVPASVHLCRLYLTPEGSSRTAEDEIDPNNVDLVAGMLSHLTRGPGWDVPEAWYFLAKAYGMQERKARERECLSLALQLSEQRGVRDLGTAVGWCI
ncbi:hypothetical protein B0H15DRAFT_347574 [Mycena belliarum]|uniref:TPR-like protein n=1 Tax=Mycena belliarum TaxID=1033014 RepID=A0AAD6U4A2_9AGAR|nr:hypothetical protein B0H15DRAFT_347574 [Mycena belliae]